MNGKGGKHNPGKENSEKKKNRQRFQRTQHVQGAITAQMSGGKSEESTEGRQVS